MGLHFLKLSTILIICILVSVAKFDGSIYSDTLEGIIQGNGGGLSETQKRLILALHNHYRANVYPTAANMQKLTWDDHLENITSVYVEKCQMAHNKQRHQLYERLSNSGGDMKKNDGQHIWVGENIAWGSGTCRRPNGTIFQCGDIFEGIKRWLLQSKNYNYSTNKCSNKCSLYTQIIWAETNRLGCAAKKCDGDKTILICNYAPGGNTPELQPYISGAPCSRCDSTHSNCEDALCVPGFVGTKKEEIIKNSNPYPLRLYDCQDQSYLYTSSDSIINLESYNDNLTPLQFEIPVNFVVNDYSLCFDIVWAITANNTLLARYMKKYSDWVDMALPAPVKKISCANSQIVWLLTTDGNIFVRHLTEISKMNNYDWWKLPNGVELFKSISCGDGSCWGITYNNETFSRKNINKENPFGNYWNPESIQLRDIITNKKNILIGTTNDNKFRFKLMSTNANWNALSKSRIDNLAFCADGVVELSDIHHSLRKISNEDYFDIKMNIPVPFIDSPKKAIKVATDSDDVIQFNKIPPSTIDNHIQNTNQNNKKVDEFTQITTLTPQNKVEVDFKKKNQVNSFEDTTLASSHQTLKPIIPLLPSFPESLPNLTPEFHFIDGYKQFDKLPIQNGPSNINIPLCCSLPDSVCPDLSHGCDAYIECNGHHPISKRCEIGNVFDPTMNICVSKEQTHFLCEAPIVFEVNNNQITIAPTSLPPVISAISNDVKWRDFEMNPHDDYIQPRVSIDKNESNYGVLREAWFNLGTSPSLDYLYNNSRYPDSPDEFLILDSFEAPPNAGDGYGQRLSSYFRPNISGEYTFFMSCDNECELRISGDEQEANLTPIISLRRGHYTSFRQTKKYPKIQKSKPIELKINNLYLLQATMKEGTVVDHLSVSIQYPNEYIDEPARFNLLLVPDKSTTIKSSTNEWNSDVGKKNRIAFKKLKRSKINKRPTKNTDKKL